MRALILSDIHGNLEALTAVLNAAGTYDQLWNLGDVVGYGGSPNQVIEVVRRVATLNVRGNHDRVCCGATSALGFNPVARAAALWTLKELAPENLLWLQELAQGPVTPGDALLYDSPINCVHGSPINEDQYILTIRDAWVPLHHGLTDLIFFGHTHVQGGFTRDGKAWQEIRPKFKSRNKAESLTMTLQRGTRHLINPGSVGQPRDYDWRAAYAIYESESAELTYHRVPYDLTMAQGRILMAGLPERLAARLREGR